MSSADRLIQMARQTSQLQPTARRKIWPLVSLSAFPVAMAAARVCSRPAEPAASAEAPMTPVL